MRGSSRDDAERVGEADAPRRSSIASGTIVRNFSIENGPPAAARPRAGRRSPGGRTRRGSRARCRRRRGERTTQTAASTESSRSHLTDPHGDELLGRARSCCSAAASHVSAARGAAVPAYGRRERGRVGEQRARTPPPARPDPRAARRARRRSRGRSGERADVASRPPAARGRARSRARPRSRSSGTGTRQRRTPPSSAAICSSRTKRSCHSIASSTPSRRACSRTGSTGSTASPATTSRTSGTRSSTAGSAQTSTSSPLYRAGARRRGASRPPAGRRPAGAAKTGWAIRTSRSRGTPRPASCSTARCDWTTTRSTSPERLSPGASCRSCRGRTSCAVSTVRRVPASRRSQWTS